MGSTRTVDKNDNIIYRKINGDLHRTDGPAFEGINGHKAWLIHGKWHREDGPAIEYPNGDVEYYLNDKEYTKEEYEREILNMRLKRIKDL